MRRSIHLGIVSLLMALAACATDASIWIIPGDDYGTAYQQAGKLSDAGDARLARIRIRVTGMRPTSPNSGERGLFLTLTCTGPAAAQVRWHDERVNPPADPNFYDRSRDFACGEDMTIPFSSEYPDRLVVLELPAGSSGEVNYTLTAKVHMSYWIIPGDNGITHQRVGKLSDAGDARLTRIRIRVTGMLPAGPHLSSHSLFMTLTCTGLAAAQVRWHDEPVELGTPDRTRDFACGEGMTIFFSYEHPDRQVVLELPAGSSGEVDYILTAVGHMPY